MKKILLGIVCDGNAGGVDKHILNFYRGIRKNSVKIDFLTNIENNPLGQELKQNGSELFCIKSLKNPLKQYSQVKQIIKKYNYDIVYLNISTAMAFPILLAAKNNSVEIIIAHSHSAGLDIQNKLKRCIFTILHKAAKPLIKYSCTHFLTCSQKAAEWMFSKSLIENGKVKYIQNAVNVEDFCFDSKKREEIRKKYGLQEKFIIGNVGNLCYQKNHLFLLQVIKKAIEKDDTVHLMIAGDGPLKKKIQKRIISLGLENNVSLLGQVKIKEGYMSAFDVFALPSRFEGMPIVSVEAQCCKLPCVLSNTISKEAKISNMCEFVSIKKAEIFSEALLKFKNINREEFQISGELSRFDIKTQLSELKKVIDREI